MFIYVLCVYLFPSVSLPVENGLRRRRKRRPDGAPSESDVLACMEKELVATAPDPFAFLINTDNGKSLSDAVPQQPTVSNPTVDGIHADSSGGSLAKSNPSSMDEILLKDGVAKNRVLDVDPSVDVCRILIPEIPSYYN